MSSPPPGRRDRVVLVADDEPDVRFVARLRLQRAGWVVEEVADGLQARARIEGGDVDALVLDQRMPGMSGLEVAAEARRAGFDGPVVIFSAYLDGTVEAEATGLGCRTLGKGEITGLAQALEG